MIKLFFCFLLFMAIPLFIEPTNTKPLQSETPHVILDESLARLPFPHISNHGNGNQQQRNNFFGPRYGYFYTKLPEILLDNASVRLDYSTLNRAGISVNQEDHQTLLFDTPGRYYISWQISAIKEFEGDPGMRFALYFPESDAELPSSLFTLQEDLKNHLLQLHGEAILDVPQSGSKIQLRNVSGFPVNLQTVTESNPFNQTPVYTASVCVLASCQTSASPMQAIANPKAKSEIYRSDLETIFGVQGHSKEEKVQFTVARKPKQGEFDLRTQASIGTLATFSGTNENAVVEGDIVVFDEELPFILNSFSKGNIDVVAIHQQNAANRNSKKSSFLHYKGQGNAKKLAQTIKNALSDSPEANIYALSWLCNIFGRKC